MIKFLQLFLILLLILSSIQAAYTDDETVILDTCELKNTRISPTITTTYYKNTDKIETKTLWLDDDDDEVFESKAGKAFSKFLNQKVVNNKLNIFSMPLGNNSEL